MRQPKTTKEKPAAPPAPVVNGSGPVLPVGPGPEPVRQRRPGMFLAAAVALIVAGGGAGLYAVNASAERTTVVGVADRVQWGEVITAQDLAPVEVVDDVNLRPVLWANRDTLIGKRAAAVLLPGSLLTADATMGDPIPAAGQAVVGITVKSSQAPLRGLVPQDKVELIAAPPASADASAKPIVYQATVVSSAAGETSGTRSIDVLVPADQAPMVAVAASAGLITVVLVPRK